MKRGTFTTLALAMALTVVLVIPPTARAQSDMPNGVFSVAVLRGGAWQPVDALAFGQNLSEQTIDLSSWVSAGQVSVRLVNPGSTAAHIDAVRLGSVVPRAVSGAAEEQSLALKKLANRDYDLIDAAQRTLTFTFDLPVGDTAIFALVARIEAEKNLGVPFEFPTSNMYGRVDNTSQFYQYRLNDVPGALNVNGDLNDEKLGVPFFKEWSQPTSGHPANFTYGWVLNDANNLYVAIDFTPDDTYDGDKDFTAVFVKTPNGVQRFKVSVPEQQWGAPGFEYTDRAVYQHKVYEYKIPLAQIGFSAAHNDAVELAFEAYGTASVTALVSSMNPSTFGQNVTFTATVSGGPVNFLSGGTSIPGCGAVPLSGSTATCSISTLTVGNHTITADAGSGPFSMTGNPQVVLAPAAPKPAEVPEADTLLLLGGGIGGLGVWLRWQWRKRRKK